jgi:uncharacterized protein (TIGR03382 family)
MKIRTLGALSACAVAALSTAPYARASTVIGLTTNNRLISFDHLAPGVLFTNVPVSGLGAGESLVGIDLRPATGQVIGVTQTGLYDLNFTTGAATLIGAGFAASPLDAGAEFGIDFNPTVDRVRVVASTSGNRRLNPVSGGAVLPVDTALTYTGTGAPVRAVGAAYTNSLAGVLPGSTRQFIIDSATDMLVETGSQAGGNASFNGGVVTPVGSLGFDTGDLVGFDIFGPTGVALISTTPGGGATSSLRILNLSNASSMFLGDIAGGTIRDITIIPAPGAIAVGGLAGLALMRRRR